MKETFNKFCKEIGFEIPQHLNGTILKEVIQEDSNEKDIFQRKLTFFIDFFLYLLLMN